MRKLGLILAVLLLTAPYSAITVLAQTGNGAPSGPHYNLNIICVPKGKTADMTGTQGHTIFVSCDGTTKINLTEGEFGVLDRNGTDGEASFQLPATDSGLISARASKTAQCTQNADLSFTCGSGTSVYSVFARALGTPGGTANMMLCYSTVVAGIVEEECSTTNQLKLDSSGRPAKFQNVTAQLLYLYNVTIGGVFYKRIPLFSDVVQDYFWSYTNNGLKLLQLRFYHCDTLVPADWPGDINDSACFAK